MNASIKRINYKARRSIIINIIILTENGKKEVIKINDPHSRSFDLNDTSRCANSNSGG